MSYRVEIQVTIKAATKEIAEKFRDQVQDYISDTFLPETAVTTSRIESPLNPDGYVSETESDNA